MTYSIVARCPTTGQLGIGVASRVLAAGRIVPFVAPQVGVVATQAHVEMAHGSRILEALTAGTGVEDALAASLAADEHPEVRQVAVVDASGRVAAHTGTRAIPAAGHVTGDGWSAQSNIAFSPAVWEDMGHAFEQTAGQPLAHRLLAAMDAAEAAGDLDGALARHERVVAAHPEDDQLRLLHAVTLAMAGRGEQARARLAPILAGPDGDRWREFLDRIEQSGAITSEIRDRLRDG